MTRLCNTVFDGDVIDNLYCNIFFKHYENISYRIMLALMTRKKGVGYILMRT
jgi:hypothetical protein